MLALGNLAVSSYSHSHLMKPDCLQALKSSLLCVDDETRFNAAFALNKLSMGGDDGRGSGVDETDENSNVTILGENGCIPGLVNVLTNGSPPAQSQAVAVLRHLSVRTENRFFILQAGALEALGKLAESITGVGEEQEGAGGVVDREKETLRELTSLTCLLTLSDGLRMPLVTSRLLVPIVTLCQHGDVEIARHACGTIANIAEAKRTHKQLVSKTVNAIHMSVFLMRSKHLSVHREAARIGTNLKFVKNCFSNLEIFIVSNMLTSSASHRLFLDDGGLISLFRLCRSLDAETLLNCALIFRKLTPVSF